MAPTGGAYTSRSRQAIHHSRVTQFECGYCQIHKTNTFKDAAWSAFPSNINANQLYDMMQLLKRGLKAGRSRLLIRSVPLNIQLTLGLQLELSQPLSLGFPLPYV